MCGSQAESPDIKVDAGYKARRPPVKVLLPSGSSSPSSDDPDTGSDACEFGKGSSPLTRQLSSFDENSALLKDDLHVPLRCRQIDVFSPDQDHIEHVKTPLTSKSHLDVWSTEAETLIIFDWDDTLCPTTYIWEHPTLKWNEVAPCYVEAEPDGSSQTGVHESLQEVLDAHQSAVIALLRLAASMGQVAVVTLAKAGWVLTSCRHFMPKVEKVLEELDIEVVYARESLPNHYLKRAKEEENDLTKVLKTRAMSKIIKKFYGKGRSSRSWKNVISIGDSAAERLALQDVIFRRVQKDSRGVMKACRCKVVKLLAEPSVERLTAQAQVLITWLCHIVSHDDDIDVDFSQMEEDADGVPSPKETVTGRRRSFSGSIEAGRMRSLSGSSVDRGSPLDVGKTQDAGGSPLDVVRTRSRSESD